MSDIIQIAGDEIVEGVPGDVTAVYSDELIGVYVATFEMPASAPSGQNIPFVVAVRIGDRLIFSNPSAIPVQ